MADLLFSLFVTTLVIVAVVAGSILLYRSLDQRSTIRDHEAKHAARCASCFAGVHHGQHSSESAD